MLPLVLFKIISANQRQGLAAGSSYTQICLHFPQEPHPHFFNSEGHFSLLKGLLRQGALASTVFCPSPLLAVVAAGPGGTRRALSTSAPPWLHRRTSKGHPKAPSCPKVEHAFPAETSLAGSLALPMMEALVLQQPDCPGDSAGTRVSLQPPALLRQGVSLHESWDTAPQLVRSLCHQPPQSSPSDNLERPYLCRPQTVPIKKILDFSLRRDVIHSHRADFSLHKTYNPHSNQSKVSAVAGQPVSGGLACYFKDKSIYFSSPSSSEHLLLPIPPHLSLSLSLLP